MKIIDTKKLFDEDISIGIGVKSSHCRMDVFYDVLVNGTKKYDKDLVVIRRDSEFIIQFFFETPHKVSQDQFKMKISTKSNKKTKIFEFCETSDTNHGFKMTIDEFTEDFIQVIIDVTTGVGIGLFSIQGELEGVPLTDKLYFAVIFNPFSINEKVYCNDPNWINHYLLSNTSKICVGNCKDYTSVKYILSQHTIECTLISCYFMSCMRYKDRCCPITVSRAVTALANAEDDNGLLQGSWTEYLNGCHPSYWRDMLDIYKDYLKTGVPVKYGQCFVFAALINSICRNIGILARAVTGFSVGYDKNKDGYLTVVIEEGTLDRISSSETIWNFHVFNNVWIYREDITISNTNDQPISYWQHIDATPQGRSDGIFREGPYPLEYLRRNIKSPCTLYDGLSIYNSINGIYRYIFVDKKGKEMRRIEKDNTCNIFFTEGLNNKLENIYDEYKTVETQKKQIDNSKFQLCYQIPSSWDITKTIPFKVEIYDASVNKKSIFNINVTLKNRFGEKLIDNPIYSKAHVFTESSYILKDTIQPINLLDSIDLSDASYCWSIRCYDCQTNKFKAKTAYTKINSFISISLNKSDDNYTVGNNKISFTVTNMLNSNISNAEIMLYNKKLLEKYYIPDITIEANQSLTITKDIPLQEGKNKIEVVIRSDIYNGTIGCYEIYG